MLAILATGFCLLAAALHFVSLAIVAWRIKSPGDLSSATGHPHVSILRPVCGLENKLELTVESTFALDYPHYEILFCVKSSSDAAIPLIQAVMARHAAIPARILIGAAEISGNPKLNNLVKGWREARHSWIVMVDSNVLLPSDYLQQLLVRWSSDTGLVSSPPFGDQAENFWAELEGAFLNTYQARWQLTADALGFGFAQGKTLFWRRDVLDALGGVRALAAEPAEDAAATKIVHAAGLKVRLARAPFAQPLGRRSLGEVWRRQLRWARLRRATFPAFFLPEVFAGGLLPLSAALALAATGVWPIGLAVVLILAWYGAEIALAVVAGWPVGRALVPALFMRDLALPALWLCAWAGNGFVWRGNAIEINAGSLSPGARKR